MQRLCLMLRPLLSSRGRTRQADPRTGGAGVVPTATSSLFKERNCQTQAPAIDHVNQLIERLSKEIPKLDLREDDAIRRDAEWHGTGLVTDIGVWKAVVSGEESASVDIVLLLQKRGSGNESQEKTNHGNHPIICSLRIC